MIEAQSLTETALARETLKRLCDRECVLHRTAQMLELVAHSSVGLGEVLQDYARQTYGQLKDIIQASSRVCRDDGQAGDAETLGNIHFVLKSVKSVLEMTPAAMQRNKADALGDKEKLTRVEAIEISHAFVQSPDIARLLSTEDCGRVFAGLAASADDNAGGSVAGQEPTFAAMSH